MRKTGNYRWFLLVGLLILGLSACAPGQENADNSSPQRTLRIITSTPQNTRTPTVTPTPIVPVLAPEDFADVEIELWYLWSPAVKDSLAEIASWFNSENEYGIELTTRAFSHPDDFESAVADALTSTDPPEIILAHPYQYQPWAAEEILVDLTPYLASEAYGSPTFETEVYPVFAERDVYEGQRWGYPGVFTGQVLLYNRSWAQELGFSNPPTDASAFQQQACAATEANNGFNGGLMIDLTQGSTTAWLLAFAGSLEKSGQYRFESEEVEEAFVFLDGLRAAGCAWEPDERYPDEAFIDRRGLFYPVSTGEIPFVAAAFEEADSSDTWIVTGYPNSAGDSVMGVHGRSYVIVQSSPKEQLASWLAVQYLTGERTQALLAQNHAYLPLDRNAAQRIEAENSLPAQWYQAAGLLEGAVDEPRLASWGVVRGIVQDATAQVLDDRFVPGTLSLLVRQLAEMAAEYNQ